MSNSSSQARAPNAGLNQLLVNPYPLLSSCCLLEPPDSTLLADLIEKIRSSRSSTVSSNRYEVRPQHPIGASSDTRTDQEQDEAGKMELQSTMDYLEKINVSLENVELFVALEIVQAPTIGEITKQGFVEGWKKAR